MSKIDELIERLCPEGVEFRRLGEVCEYVRGVTYSKGDEIQSTDESYVKVLRANNIDLDTNTLCLDDIKLISTRVRVKQSQWLKKGDILICAGSGSKEHIGKVAYIFEDIDYSFGGFMAVVRCSSILNTRFLFHYLTSISFRDYLQESISSSTINNLNSSIMNNFLIPLPPLAVQEEIVRILDAFTSLEAELEAELEARKKQYAYYRDTLLSFDRDDPNVEWKRLGEVCEIGTGTKPQNIEDYITPFEYINAGTSNSGYTNTANCLGETVTTPSRGQGGIGYIGYQKNPFWLGPLCYKIRSSFPCNVLTKFIFYCMQSRDNEIRRMMNEGGTPALNRSDLIKFVFPIPPLAVQQEIVRILDKFEALTSDLQSGLPAEIEARRKQYEYYRDRLLTFKVKSDE